MTIVHAGNQEYLGQSGDTKPTVGIPTGAMYRDASTGSEFRFDSSTSRWVPTGQRVVTITNLNTSSLSSGLYAPLGGSIGASATLSARQHEIPWNLYVTSLSCRLSANAMSGNTIINLQAANADISGTAFTVTANTAGHYSIRNLSNEIASGSMINWRLDTTAAVVSGNINFTGLMLEGIAY